ncbi:hypothetical protein [Paenibacillus harenae]|uniref:hypothetical protein n=1 Tax=Paenibacillus harenae TaxID=306543 RepID=UPI0004903D7A|nr:hypothetical protein [Paenibacillus harenae]
MKRNVESIELRLARFTQDGLMLNDKIYTNARMLECNWFESARLHGEREVPVLYNPLNPNKLVFFDFNELEIASTVENQQQDNMNDLEAYYFALNELKQKFLPKKDK